MEYLPWGLMALGLFLLFVYRHRRSSGEGSVGISAKPYSAGKATRGRAPGVVVRTTDEAPILPPSPPHSPAKRIHASAVWMPIILSLLVIGAALAVILLPGYYGEEQQKWAFGIIGVILGYWFKQ